MGLTRIVARLSPSFYGRRRHSDFCAVSHCSGNRRLEGGRAREDGSPCQRLRGRPGAKNPDRFGYFATLPLPDVHASLAEMARAFEKLRVDGVVLHSNFDGIYLADARFF
jgi:hypothetical protein